MNFEYHPFVTVNDGGLTLHTAVFQWLSKNKNQSNYFDQSQEEQAPRWTNQNSQQSPVTHSKCGEKTRIHGAIGFGFDSHWLKNWHESFKPIIEPSNCNHVIAFDNHLKTACTPIWRSLLTNDRQSVSEAW